MNHSIGHISRISLCGGSGFKELEHRCEEQKVQIHEQAKQIHDTQHLGICCGTGMYRTTSQVMGLPAKILQGFCNPRLWCLVEREPDIARFSRLRQKMNEIQQHLESEVQQAHRQLLALAVRVSLC